MYEIKYRYDSEIVDSEVTWIDEIPLGWKIKKLKYIANSVKNGIWGEDEKQNKNDIPCIRVADFDRQKNKIKMNNLTLRNLDANKQRVYLLKEHDLLIEKSGGGEKNPVGFVCIYESKEPAIYANFMAKIDIKEENYNKYFLYYFRHLYNKRINFKHVNQTTGIQNINTKSYFEEKVMLPLKVEQQKIANFLDIKTTEFDKIIEKKEQLIEKLEEAKKSLISEVVTGKVKIVDGKLIARDESKMKYSGVEWLGIIPNDWKCVRAKYLMNISGGYSFSTNEFCEDGIQVIKIANLYQNKLSLNSQPSYISKDYLKRYKSFIVKKDDILISLTGTLGKRDYGFAILLSENDEYLLNQRVGKINVKENYNLHYVLYLIRSEGYLSQLYSYPSGTKQANLSNEDITKPIMTIPISINEQNQIVEFLDKKCEVIQQVLKKTISQIQKLKQAKQSLISEAVTGKIDLRDWEIVEKGE